MFISLFYEHVTEDTINYAYSVPFIERTHTVNPSFILDSVRRTGFVKKIPYFY